MNLALLLVVGLFNIPMILSGNVHFDSDILMGLPLFLLTVVFIFVGIMLFTFVGTLFSKRRWKYQVTTGGGMLSIVGALLGAFIPIGGGFYPEKYENTPQLHRDMAITAFLPWLFLLALMPLFQTLGLNQIIVTILLIFRCIPWVSVNMGTSRIFHRSKVLWLVMVLATIVVLILF